MPDLQLYDVEAIDDVLGVGVRVQTMDDQAYEAREHDAGASRIYRPEDAEYWLVKINHPPDDLEEAYNTFCRISDRAASYYGMDLEMTGKRFYDTVTDGRTPHTQDDFVEMSYLEDGNEIAVPGYDFAFTSSHETYMRSGVAGYLGGGVSVGLATDPIIMLPAAVVGGLAGPALVKAASTGSQKAESVLNDRRERKYRQHSRLQDGSLFDRLNTRNSFDAYLDEVTLDEAKGKRRDELTASGIDEEWETLQTLHFDRFHDWEGVNTEARFDTYEGATRFANTVLHDVDEPLDREHVYQNPDAVKTFLDHLVFEEDDETHILDAGIDLLKQIICDTDESPAMDAMLEQYDAAVDRAGESILDDLPS